MIHIGEGFPPIDTDSFVDNFVVEYDRYDNGLYAAHCMRTDQIGVADSMEEALWRLSQAVIDLLYDDAKEDNMCVWQGGPTDLEPIPIPDNVRESIRRRFEKRRHEPQDEWIPDDD